MKIAKISSLCLLISFTNACSINATSPEQITSPMVIDPQPDMCTIYFVKEQKVQPLSRTNTICHSSQDAMQQLLLGPHENEKAEGYLSELPNVGNALPRVHYKFRSGKKTIMLLPVGLRQISDRGLAQIECTISKTHDKENIIIEGTDGIVKELKNCSQ